MRTIALCLSAWVLAPLCCFGQAYPAAGPYGPEDIEAIIAGAIKQRVGLPEDSKPPYWFSLSLLGQSMGSNVTKPEDGGDVVNPNDEIGINTLGNFIPPAKTDQLVIDLNRRFDDWYELVLNSITFPKVEYKAEYTEALKKLYILDAEGEIETETDRMVRYLDAFDEWTVLRDAKNAMMESNEWSGLSATEKATMDSNLRKAKRSFDRAGRAVEMYLEIVDNTEYKAGYRQNQLRKRILAYYREKSPEGAGEGVTPRSFFFPGRDQWGADDGWLATSFSNTNSKSYYEKEINRMQGRGGLRLGFIRIGGSAGSTKTHERSFNEVNSFAFSFALKRVLIYRPWFRSSLFESNGFTWAETKAGTTFPKIAVDMENGAPQASDGVYKGDKVGCALMPVQLILAKDLSVTATTSDSNFERLEKVVHGSGGASLFGIFKIGGSGSKDFTSIKRENNNVTFTIKSSGMSIIGVVSRVLPDSPNPDLSRDWPAGAWKP